MKLTLLRTLVLLGAAGAASAFGQITLLNETDWAGTTYAGTAGTASVQSGSVTGTFAPSNSTWGVAGNGLSFSTDSGAVVFSALNTTGFTDVTLSLRLAALSINSAANGMDGGDTFVVSISTDGGTTFFDQIRVNGNTNARWSFVGATGTASRTYSTDPVTAFAPSGGGNLTGATSYSFLTVTNLPIVSGVVIRLTATDNDPNERWLIDNVVVTAIPEPSSFAALAGLAALAGTVGVRRRRRL